MKRTSGGVFKPRTPSRSASRSASMASGQQVQRRVSGPMYKVFRFKVLAENKIDLSGQSLVAAAGIVEFSATVARFINDCIRVHHVRILGKPPQGASDIAAVSVEFSGGLNRGDNDRVVNSSNNPNIAPRVYAKPSRYSTASDWVNQSVTDTLVSFTAPIGSIVEIGMHVTGPEDGQALQTVSITGGTLGRFNYLRPSTDLAVIA